MNYEKIQAPKLLHLPVVSPSKYLSPSSFMEFKNCAQKFYLSRLAGYPYIESEWTRPAAVGTAFDAYAKHSYNTGKPTCSLKRNLKGIEHEWAEEGRMLWAYYRSHSWDTKIPQPFEPEVQLYVTMEGVPLFGKLDGVADGMPFDWKCRFNCSPTQGYSWRSDTGTGYGTSIPMNKTNKAWATQIVFYNWMLSNTEYKGVIHEIITRPKKDPLLAIHEVSIEPLFVEQLKHEVKEVWENINQLSCYIEPPTPDLRKCHAYNSICKMSLLCNAYQREKVSWSTS